MEYINYTILILITISILSFFLYKNKSIKESLLPTSEPSNLACPTINGTIDTECYDRQIVELTNQYNYLMARIPLKFYAGNIEYNYDTKTPLVVFSGGIPTIYVSMRLPYPEPGDNGDPGSPGSPGNPGSQGPRGSVGLSGYSGLSYSGFLNSKLSK